MYVFCEFCSVLFGEKCCVCITFEYEKTGSLKVLLQGVDARLLGVRQYVQRMKEWLDRARHRCKEGKAGEVREEDLGEEEEFRRGDREGKEGGYIDAQQRGVAVAEPS